MDREALVKGCSLIICNPDLDGMGSIAAVLRFPMPELEDLAIDDDDDDDDDDI